MGDFPVVVVRSTMAFVPVSADAYPRPTEDTALIGLYPGPPVVHLPDTSAMSSPLQTMGCLSTTIRTLPPLWL